MKIAYEKISTVIEMIPGQMNGLVVENAGMLYQLLTDLKETLDGKGAGFVCSKEDKLITASKTVELVTDFVNFQFNSRTIISKMISSLEQRALSGEFYLQTQELLAHIENYMDDLTMDIPYDFMCEKQNIQSLLKGLGITVADQFDTLEEKVLAYMDLVREFDKKELFIFWNLRCLIPQGRLQLMVDTAMQREHKILFIDSTEYPKLKQERRLIIDEDLCEI